MGKEVFRVDRHFQISEEVLLAEGRSLLAPVAIKHAEDAHVVVLVKLLICDELQKSVSDDGLNGGGVQTDPIGLKL